MKKSQYYVYIYYDPDTMIPFYVGKGHNYRYRFHIYEAQNYGKKKAVRFLNIPKIKKIKSLLDSGKEPLIIKVFHGTHEACLNEEVRLISLFGKSPRGPLLNMTEGGDGTCGYHHTDKTRELLSRQKKGKAVTRHSEEWKQHLREHNSGGIATSKKVCKLTLNGEIIQTYPSMTALAKKLGMLKGNCLAYVVKDGSMPRDGFFYRYANSSDITPYGIKNAEKLILYRARHEAGNLAGKAVVRKSLGGEPLEEFQTIREAAASVPHIKYATLWAAIKYGRKCAESFWSYA